MTSRARQIILVSVAALFAIALALFAANRDVANDLAPPRDVRGMAAWIARHPADWLTASELSDAALDARLPRRTELWRASYALASHVAPRLRNPRAAFVRGGLFHWYELNAADRKAVLDTAAPLLRDPKFFGDVHRPLWELTRDFDYILRNAPQTLDALEGLRAVAASNGLFAEYRKARTAIERRRLAAPTASMQPHELPSLLPRRITTSEEPLVRRILQQLHQTSFDPSRFGDPTNAMIEYALAHELQPLEGLAPFVEATKVIPELTRARLALALNQPDAATAIELTSATAGTPVWNPYYLDRARFEARRGNAAASDAQLRRAALHGLDATILGAAEECAILLRNEKAAAQFREQLAAIAKRPHEWSTTCGTNELCETARAQIYSTGAIEIKTDVVQSDQVAPYVEIYADDARVAEGAVGSERRFTLPLARGMHRIEVRLVNPRLANGAQRRVRLS